MTASYPYRRSGIAVRVMNVISAACCLVAAALFLASHHLMLAIFMLVVAVLDAGLFVLNTKLAAARRARHIAAHRPRPEWSRIYAAERAIYGRTFEHAGAPDPSAPGYGEKGHTITGPLRTQCDRAASPVAVRYALEVEEKVEPVGYVWVEAPER
jgi:hypothetical protein